MSSRPHPPFCPLSTALVLILIMLGPGFSQAGLTESELQESAPQADGLPQAVDLEADFNALATNSPFLRSLNLSDSLALTGVARVGEENIVVLYDRETKETQVVSSSANAKGLRLVGVDGTQANLESMTARISTTGGEVFSVRYDEKQLKPEESMRASSDRGRFRGPPDRGSISDQARNYKDGISGDGFHGPPPPELVKKLSKLSQDQRENVIREISEMRARGASSEERREAFTRMVDRALRDRR